MRRASASRPGVAIAAGRLFSGKLLDPRLDVLCRDPKGRPLAYAWVEPAAGARWIGVDQGTYTEVYEVLAGYPCGLHPPAGSSRAERVRPST